MGGRQVTAVFALLLAVLAILLALGLIAVRLRKAHVHVEIDRSTDATTEAVTAVTPPPASLGVDRVPERFRDRARPTQWIVRHEYGPKSGLPINAKPYRNPERLARLAKNGRLRPELRATGASSARS